jgi:hypothetical protein
VNAAEYAALGVVLMRYRDAVDRVDASLLCAMAICAETDLAKASDLALARAAVLDALAVVDGLLEGGKQRRAS